MKILSNFVMLIVITHSTFAQQQNLMNILGNVPPIPQNICQDSKEQKDIFQRQISNVKSLIKIETKRISQYNNAQGEVYREKAMKENASQYGFSEEDIKRINQGVESEQLKKQMMDKALQNKANLSMDEVKKIQNMSQEGKKAWAEAYGYEKMAEASADSVKLKKDREKNMNMYDLLQMQLKLNEDLNKMEMDQMQHFNEFKSNSNIAEKLQQIYQLRAELANTNPLDDKYDNLKTNLELKEMEYCNTFSNQYTILLKEQLNQFSLNIPLYYHLEDVNRQLTEMQTGIEMNMESGSLAFSKLENYLDNLFQAYQYNLTIDQ